MRANLGEGDRLAGLKVRRTADDLERLFGAVLNRGEPQAVGVRMWIDGSDATDDNLLPVAAATFDCFYFRTGHAQPMRHSSTEKSQST